MGIFRILIFVLLIYLAIRLVRGVGRKTKPKIRRGRAKQKPNPLDGADVEDVNFTELPPEESGKQENKSNRSDKKISTS